MSEVRRVDKMRKERQAKLKRREKKSKARRKQWNETVSAFPTLDFVVILVAKP